MSTRLDYPALLAFATGSLLLATPATASEQCRVQGEVTYLQRIAMPDYARVNVALIDSEEKDRTKAIIGRFALTMNGRQVPVRFDFNVSCARLKASGNAALKANISTWGRARFITNKPVAYRKGAHHRLVLQSY